MVNNDYEVNVYKIITLYWGVPFLELKQLIMLIDFLSLYNNYDNVFMHTLVCIILRIVLAL